MKLFSVAIGDSYEKEAQRLVRSMLPLSVEVFTKSSALYEEVNKDPIINGLWHKCNFANYISDVDGPVVFMDADMFSLQENPLSSFAVKKRTDFAYVPYSGTWHYPDTARQEAFNYHGHKINSGFMYFRTLAIAQSICTAWVVEYEKRVAMYGVVPNINKNEYDEYALMLSLVGTKYKVELLDNKWNNWELDTLEEIQASKFIFFQSHKHLDIV